MALLLAAALAAGLLALATSASEPAQAAQFKTVTKTFNKNVFIEIPGGFGSQIGPAFPYPSEKNVGMSSFPKGAKILDLNLTLRGFGHAASDDVDMMLVHRGLNRTVFSDVGGFTDVTDLTLTLDDEASATLPDPLTSGKFKPFNSGTFDSLPAPAPTQNASARLDGFDGLNPEGPWKLFIQDDASQDAGSLGEGWSLKIKAKFPTN